MDIPLIIERLSSHLKEAIILALVLLVVVLKWGNRIRKWIGSLLGVYTEAHSSQQRLADGYKNERDECWRQKNQIDTHLLECRRVVERLQRANEMGRDASAQDRAYIRALERCCDEQEPPIEYDEIRDKLIDKYLAERAWKTD